MGTTFTTLYGDVFTCEDCGTVFYTKDISDWNYCPNCGEEIEDFKSDWE